MELTITIEQFVYFLNNYDDEYDQLNYLDEEKPSSQELEDQVTPFLAASLLEAEKVTVLDENPLYGRKYDILNDTPRFFSRTNSPLKEITFQKSVRLDKVSIYLNEDLTLNFHQTNAFSLSLGTLYNYPDRDFYVSFPNISEMNEFGLFASETRGDSNRPTFHVPRESIFVNKKLVLKDINLVGSSGDATIFFRALDQFYTNVELPPQAVLYMAKNLGHVLLAIDEYNIEGTDLDPLIAGALDNLLYKQMNGQMFLYSGMPLYAQLPRTEKKVNLVLKPTKSTAITKEHLELSENISLRFKYSEIESDYLITDILVYNETSETVASVSNYKDLYQVGDTITNEDLSKELVDRLYTLPVLPFNTQFTNKKHGFKVLPQVSL